MDQIVDRRQCRNPTWKSLYVWYLLQAFRCVGPVFVAETIPQIPVGYGRPALAASGDLAHYAKTRASCVR
jgi:hypothetical protein